MEQNTGTVYSAKCIKIRLESLDVHVRGITKFTVIANIIKVNSTGLKQNVSKPLTRSMSR